MNLLYLLKKNPGGSDSKESAFNTGDPGLIPGLGRSPGIGNSNPLHYSCLGSPRTEESGWPESNVVVKNQMQLSVLTL